MDGMAGDDQDGNDLDGFLGGLEQDENGLRPDGGDLGPWVQGLSTAERAVIDRVARERDRDLGREQLGRYARSHQGALPEGTDGGLVDADTVLDQLIITAKSFEEEQTEAAAYERQLLREALDRSISLATKQQFFDPDVAHFSAYVPNGGVKTNRENEWVLTLHVAWEDRDEVSRIIETIPMSVNVTVQRGQD